MRDFPTSPGTQLFRCPTISPAQITLKVYHKDAVASQLNPFNSDQRFFYSGLRWHTPQSQYFTTRLFSTVFQLVYEGRFSQHIRTITFIRLQVAHQLSVGFLVRCANEYTHTVQDLLTRVRYCHQTVSPIGEELEVGFTSDGINVVRDRIGAQFSALRFSTVFQVSSHLSQRPFTGLDQLAISQGHDQRLFSHVVQTFDPTVSQSN